MSNITDFISQYGDLANTVATNTGLSQSEVLGQWGLETGWGAHFAGTNNFGNVSPGGVVANYATPEAGAQAYMGALASEGIPTADLGSTPGLFGQALQTAGYATDPNYASKVSNAASAVQAAVDGSGPSSAGSGSPKSVSELMAGNGGALQNADGSTPSPSNIPGVSAVGSFISSHIGDYGLVFFGLILGVGALLISQKGTVITLAKAVAK